jgi:hypothetical protein
MYLIFGGRNLEKRRIPLPIGYPNNKKPFLGFKEF